MKRSYADTPEGQIHYVTEGQGDPLLLLHQSPRSLRMYVDLIPLLAKHYRVIATDTLGCGFSDPPPPNVQIADLARATAHFLETLKIKRTHVFGVHTGCSIGTELAAAWPEKVASLSFFGYTFVESEAERKASLERLPTSAARLDQVSADGTHLTIGWAWAYQAVLNMLWEAGTPPTPNPSPQVMRFLDRSLLDLTQTRGNIAAISGALFRYDSHKRLPLVKAPAMHIQGGSRFEVVYSTRGDQVAKLMRQCETAVIPGADGNVAEWKAPELAEKILAFLRKHPLQ